MINLENESELKHFLQIINVVLHEDNWEEEIDISQYGEISQEYKYTGTYNLIDEAREKLQKLKNL